LRTEYVSRLESARQEVEHRVELLADKRLSQETALAKLESDRAQLRRQAESLSERYEDVRDAGEQLTNRVENILSAVQRRLPVTTDAELKMGRDVQQLSRQLCEIGEAVKQLRAKETYQRRQLAAAAGSVRARPVVGEMGENQMNSVKEILQKDSKQIAELVKSVNAAKKDLGM
jgi:chromosome segregation ATPase